MKFYVSYFGCRTNQAEIQEWIVELEDFGYKLTNSISDADFGILNTCSVTERAEKDIYKFISKAFKNTNTQWFIIGCMVSKEKQLLQSKYKNYYFFDNVEKQHLLDFIKEKFPVSENIIFHSAFRSRIFLKVQDGCNFRCSFCIVPFLRGKSRSLPSGELVKKVKFFESLGYKEIILTGINLSSYGYDLFPRENLLDLIKKVKRIRGIDIIRLSSLDPRYIKYGFIKELSYIKKIAPSFHFSFQSGCNQVLKRMRRASKVSEYSKILGHFSHFFPEANFGADILVGFPGENDKEFNETLNFVRQSPLNYVHIFPFSPRGGTKAALREQLPSNIVRKRVKELKEINRNKKIEYRERYRKNILRGILIEENPNYSLVITNNFISVRVPPIKGYKKRKVKVKIHRIVNEQICEGTIVKR